MQSEDFEFANADASLSVPKQCSALRKSQFVLLRNRPCKIVEMSTSQPGKHGHAKIHLIGIDIFTAKKYEDICPATHNMQCPVVKRKEYELIWFDDDGFCSLFDTADTLGKNDHLKLPDNELGKQIAGAYEKDQDGAQNGILLSVVEAMGEEAIVAFKHRPKD